MAVGLALPISLQRIAGVKLASVYVGIRKQSADDVVLIEIPDGAVVAATFTRNAFCAAPVHLAKQYLALATPRFLLINAGNANAGTGQAGLNAAQLACQAIADIASCLPEQVLPFSTGVIGQPLPVEKIQHHAKALYDNLSEAHWLAAAKGIMTTDTIPKAVSDEFTVAGQTYYITGISKGSGMIKPDMATMLSFIATDIPLSQQMANTVHSRLVEASFNRITIDSDTSTNDACVLIATNQMATDDFDSIENLEEQVFTALLPTYLKLAHAVVRDAEGATKFVSINIHKAASTAEALTVAYTVAHSPLVKTALYASDANWGRILAAIGRANIDKLDIHSIDILINQIPIITQGEPDSAYTEAQGSAAMAVTEIAIDIYLGRGVVAETVWTSDLSHQYVTINAEYRT